jgi:hypothetical protein
MGWKGHAMYIDVVVLIGEVGLMLWCFPSPGYSHDSSGGTPAFRRNTITLKRGWLYTCSFFLLTVSRRFSFGFLG